MLSNLKSKLFKSIKNRKLNVFGFFLLLSFMFLVITKLSKTYTETIAFHVSCEHVPEQHSIIPNHDSIINVRVKAYGFNLISHNFFRHTFKVDFNKEVRKSGNNYIWNTKQGISKINSQLGPAIQVLSIQPDSLKFPFEIMSVKTVPIKLDADITYTDGYDIRDSLKMVPDSVKVIGPKNFIENISKIKTKKITLKNVNANIDKEVDLLIDKPLENIKVSQAAIHIFGTVEKFTEGTFEVPLDIINLPSELKINYFPKTVSVSYYVSLQNYKNIRALDFKVVCDYNEVKNEDKTFFTPKLIEKPSLVKSAKIKQNKIEFIIVQ
ncbi:MAG: YbbR-like domain-containing protein [Gelidibacter sp.]